MKPLFTDQPNFWLRTSRCDQSRADYANPLTVCERGHRVVPWFCAAGFVVIVGLLFMGAI